MSSHPALQQALRHCIRERLTFAAFRTPGGQVTLWAQQTPELDHCEPGTWWKLNDVFIVSPFHMGERIPMIRSDVELTFGDSEPHWHRLLECSGSAAVTEPPVQPVGTRHSFESAVEELRGECERGPLEKVVLSRTVRSGMEALDAARLFTEAVGSRPDAFVALAGIPEHGLWLGASPERLVLAENDRVVLDAIAGTVPSFSAPPDPSDWGAKERHEQRVVVKSIIGTLLDLDARSITMEGPVVIKAGPVAHLRTRIGATLDNRSTEELVRAIHPTPAVCGIPTNLAIQRIQQHEDRPRDLYAGAWGPWSADGRMELFVNIRCMRVFSDHADLYVGAGITAGSKASAEWEETELKADSWRRSMLAGQRADKDDAYQ